MNISAYLPLFLALPAEPFLLGSPTHALGDLARHYGGTRESYREESPQHVVRLPAFAIARTPVTNRLYAAYLAASGRQAPHYWHGPTPPDERLDHPVVELSWQDTQAFCSWLTTRAAGELQLVDQRGARTTLGLASVAIRLPGEAEWEYAARGIDGRLFPWGDQFDAARANTREGGPASTTPVEAYPAGAAPCGALDMAGNVWEWTASLDQPYPYDPAGGREELQAAGRRILRGGSYANPQGFARCACRFRLLPGVRNEFIGFRLAISL